MADAPIRKEDLALIQLTSSDFSKFAEGKAIYVDKTRLLSQLILEATSFFMFVRPRRMGKSLTLDTIAKIYEGKRDLFKGTWIGGQDDAFWNKIGKYPVISIEAPNFPEDMDLKRRWNEVLDRCAKSHGVSVADISSPEGKLTEIVTEVAKGSKYNEKRCVLLFDEYDRPLSSCITGDPDPKTLEHSRVITHNIYAVLKELDNEGYVQKCLFTGNAKFARLSVFSGNKLSCNNISIAMNNLKDISEAPGYANLIGITKEEVENNNSILQYLQFIAQRFKKETGKDTTPDAVLNQLLEYYDGYQFSSNTTIKVLNPFSFMNYLHDSKDEGREISDGRKLNLERYWLESGTPSHLVYNLDKHPLRTSVYLGAENVILPKKILEGSCVPSEYRCNLPLQLYQTGYLTIDHFHKDSNPEKAEYHLRFPNYEVRSAFEGRLKEIWASMRLNDLMKCMKQRNFDETFLAIEGFFKKMEIPPGENEFSYHGLLFSWIKAKKEEGEVCIGEEYLTEKGKRRRPDITWIYKDSNGNCWINLLELRMADSDIGDTPIKRGYIQKAKGDAVMQNRLKGLRSVKAFYRTVYIICEGGNAKDMVVHESTGNEGEPKEVYRKQTNPPNPKYQPQSDYLTHNY
eukprot:TRINITY_DN465_c0_g1_i1.p1 TRINITY_DN465_c0_g1~~TRINITY_DN465_c0_g1_i1.p1  ORF type:complete len:628 (-),score=65.73 TRINITY_DN465_c0_g1_i1:287-2170(-)